MRRQHRMLMFAAGLVAVLVSAILLSPTGALGQERGRTAAAKGPGIVAVGQNVTISEPLQGSIQVLAGSVTIDAPVHGSVIAFGADVTIHQGGRIEGDLFCLGGRLDGVGAEQVAGEVYAPASITAALEGVSRGQRPFVNATENPFSLVTVALKLSLLLVWLAVAVVVTLMQGREVRMSSLEVRASPFYTFFLGMVAFTSFVLTAIVFSYLIPYLIGILLLIVLGLFAIVTKVYGMITIFHAVGWAVAGPRTHQAARARRFFRGDLAMVIVGLLILGSIRMIPVVGNVIWMTASLVGIGVTLATRFGRREPSFLAWHPAQETVVSHQ